MDYIQKTKLDCKDPVGNGIACPVFETGTESYIPSASTDLTDKGTDINIGYDHTDRAKKWERPHPQDVPEAGKNQYQ